MRGIEEAEVKFNPQRANCSSNWSRQAFTTTEENLNVLNDAVETRDVKRSALRTLLWQLRATCVPSVTLVEITTGCLAILADRDFDIRRRALRVVAAAVGSAQRAASSKLPNAMQCTDPDANALQALTTQVQRALRSFGLRDPNSCVRTDALIGLLQLHRSGVPLEVEASFKCADAALDDDQQEVRDCGIAPVVACAHLHRVREAEQRPGLDPPLPPTITYGQGGGAAPGLDPPLPPTITYGQGGWAVLSLDLPPPHQH
ncbi:hypothetical protein CYMTET_13754 [Cymbomonas tetramitiformis]|uniref:Uncharacterized protein n=1 Tax=Cymbomonas tetramitiformis TaxID=36881 RepID=A0AAE0LAV9_9CHLO|nr:hypothetical protein CYMTET_13754 [Cymbomonas tetramitiformis]